MDETVAARRPTPLLRWPTYIGVCCREWVMPVGVRPGRCGLCGTRPVFLRKDG